MQSKIDEHLLQLNRQEEICRLVKSEFENRLSDQEATARIRFGTELQQRKDLQVESKKQEEELQGLKIELVNKNHELLSKDQEIARAARDFSKREKEWEKEFLNKEKEMSKKEKELVKKDREIEER